MLHSAQDWLAQPERIATKLLSLGFKKQWSRVVIAVTTLSFLLMTFRVFNPSLIALLPADIAEIEDTADRLVRTPIKPADFAEVGRLLETVNEWHTTVARTPLLRSYGIRALLETQTERVIDYAFPFLTKNSSDHLPLGTLRRSFVQGSKGIVIPTGKNNFRYTLHLLANLEYVETDLPIEIAYAGDDDLPEIYRDALASICSDVRFLDVTTLFDDTITGLRNGTWAIKPFATLASSFEQVIALDADAFFFQKPESVIDRFGEYKKTGAYYFHDRLVWKGAFPDRHAWWEDLMKGRVPSETLNRSKVYNEGYAEEADSGLVAVDKSRLTTVLGLLHVCWQNTKAVREEVTYKQTYGDKESWWLGFELSGSPYSFENHYAAMLGMFDPGRNKTCSATIAHVDERDRLFWVNGGLLKNKVSSKTEYWTPNLWLVDGVWDKRGRGVASCMDGAEIRQTSDEEARTLSVAVKYAIALDERFAPLIVL